AVEAGEEAAPRPNEVLFTADGKKLLSWDTTGAVARWERKGDRWRLERVSPPLKSLLRQFAVSADGRTLAYTDVVKGAGKTAVLVKDLDRPEAEPREIDRTPAGSGSALALSDDGRLLAFDRPGEVAVWD